MEVLVIDDHQVVHEVFAALATKTFPRASVSVAPDLARALRLAARRIPDLVLLDLGLPECSGIEALERFRAAFPAVPVLVVSASEDAAHIKASMDAGACGYICKTASLPSIAAAMKTVASGGRYAPYEEAGLRLH
jgi:DNA-binding NarL/FixJ family response regulator